MKHLIRLTFLFLLLVIITVTCNKDDDVPETETILASTGGIIKIESGAFIDIPPNALPSDKTITVETINPYLCTYCMISGTATDLAIWDI